MRAPVHPQKEDIKKRRRSQLQDANALCIHDLDTKIRLVNREARRELFDTQARQSERLRLAESHLPVSVHQT